MSELRGDEGALYERYHDELWRAVRRAVYGDDELVEDACSFAWARLLTHQPDRGPTLFGWLRVVAIREAWTLYRRARRKAPVLGAYEHKLNPIEKTVLDPVDLDLQLDSRLAADVLRELPEREGRYLALLAAGYSYREIQELDDVSYTAVNRYVARARARVHEMRAQGRI